MSSARNALTTPMGKEAELFRPLPNGKIQCTACARYCQLGEGQVGFCGVRGVVGGKLWLLVYGRVMAGYIDPIEKKPVMHYRPGSKIFSIATSGCSWRCHPAGSRVLMADGTTKRVETLSPGDVVWSYELGREVKAQPNVITHTNIREAEVWEVEYGHDGRLRITGDHPVLTMKGWKETKDLGPGDHILRVWNAKGECGTNVGLQSDNRDARPLELSDQRQAGIMESDAGLMMRKFRTATNSRPRSGISQNLPAGVQPHAARFERTPDNENGGADLVNGFSARPGPVVAGGRNSAQVDTEDFGGTGLNAEDREAYDVWYDYPSDYGTALLEQVGEQSTRLSTGYLQLHAAEVKKLVNERVRGRILRDIRQWVEVKGVRATGEVVRVYGFETFPDHNYVADGVLVHNCLYCQNYDISQRRKVEGMELSPGDAVELAAKRGCEGIAYTYNEPSIFMEYAKDAGKLARKKGLFNIFVSNGYDTPQSVAAMGEFLDCITVDFKGSGETSFVRKYISIPDASPIFQSLLEIKNKTRIHVEITDLIVPKVGDSLEAADKLSKWVFDNLGPDTPIHFLRFHPDYMMMDLPVTPIETLEKHYDVAKKAGLKYVYIGNVPGHPAENTYCPGCSKVLIRRHGYYILAYNLDEKGRCIFCGYQTPIVGPLSKSVTEDRFQSVIG